MSLFVSIFFLTCKASSQEPNTSNPKIDSSRIFTLVNPVGKLFPSFTASNGRRTVSNEQLKNKIVLINFWFEGCHPCMAEMEALNELHQQLKDNKDFLFISFTWDSPEAVKRVKKQYHPTFDVLSTTVNECNRLNFDHGYPTNMILDRRGMIKYTHSSGFEKKEHAREFVMTTLLPAIQNEF